LAVSTDDDVTSSPVLPIPLDAVRSVKHLENFIGVDAMRPELVFVFVVDRERPDART
jgi:hypothetical protein